MNQSYRVKGAFFENPRQTGPAFSGFIEIDGVRTEIALWPKTSAKGTNYFQVSEDKKKQKVMKSMHASPFRPKGNPQITTGPQGQRQVPNKGLIDDDFDDTDSIPF